MTKMNVIQFILKKRIPNILLLSVMFTSLIVIFMVGIGIKNVFYDYLRSSYGNIPDVKLQFSNLDTQKGYSLIEEIRQKYSANFPQALLGYEKLHTVSIIDSEDLLLTSGLELLIKGVDFKKEVQLEIDGKKIILPVVSIDYQEEMRIELALNGLKIANLETVAFLAQGKPIEYDFCKKIIQDGDGLIIRAIDCETKTDKLQDLLEKEKPQMIKVEVDGKVFDTKIIFNDISYKSLVLDPKGITEAKNISLHYKDFEVDNSMVADVLITNGELVVNFKEDRTKNKKFKLFLSKILKDFIDYNRMVLKLQLHSFGDDEDAQKQDKELVYLDELTDLIDLIFASDKGNLAISSSFLAQDLNNFGVLDNFTLQAKESGFGFSIRSTIEYNPEKLYDKNILIVNKKLLDEKFGIENKNNFIDLYLSKPFTTAEIIELQSLAKKYDTNVKLVMQEEIISSIGPKKFIFDMVVLLIALFILTILFIAMYIVLRQFYSNFNSELSLLKLYGSKITYQAIINSCSFLISAGLNYLFLVKEEEIINQIMLKYFFKEYSISMVDYGISIGILFIYIVIIYFLEYKEIKKLNLIKGQ